MSPAQVLPKKGDRVYAWVPKLHKEVAATVEAVRGKKLTVTVYTGDNGLEKFSGIERWKPAETGKKLKGEQLPLPEVNLSIDNSGNATITHDLEKTEAPAEAEPETPAPVEEPPKNFDPSTYEIDIADIWPTEKDFDENTDEAIALQPRNRIDADTVNRYVEIFDALPAIDVFKVHGQTGYCLAGGWHRRAAAVKLGRTSIKANVHIGTIEEAILFAATDNLTSGLQLTKSEIEEACKNFLKIADLLPASKVDSLVAEVNRKFGKKATELSNVVIGLMFGVSDRTIGNYRKDLETEKLMAQFASGQRVEIVAKAYESVDPIYRRGKVSHKDRYKLWISPDFEDRSFGGGFAPGDVIKTDEPKAAVELAESFAPGDKIKHWKTDATGVVASVDWPNKDWIWSFNTVSPASPVVMFDGKLEVCRAREFDLVSAGEPPTVEECLLITRHQLATLPEDNAYDKRKLAGRIEFLEALLNPEPVKTEAVTTDAAQPAAEPTPTPATTPTELKTYTNARAEVEAKGKQLGLTGSERQQLPTVEHKEDPTVTGDTLSAAVATNARKASLVNEIMEMIEETMPDEDEALDILIKLKKYLPEDWKELT